VEKIQPLIRPLRETGIAGSGDERWVLQETARAYGQETGAKTVAKHVF
jgi:hypothetical protein